MVLTEESMILKEKRYMWFREREKKDRYVVLSDKALDVLQEYFKRYKPSNYLVEGASGGRYSDKSVKAS